PIPTGLSRLNKTYVALHSVNQYVNITLINSSVNNVENCSHMLIVKNCFIQDSICYVQLQVDKVDTQLPQDAAQSDIPISGFYSCQPFHSSAPNAASPKDLTLIHNLLSPTQ
uniref:Uncharacterized protein n=1 Tax=Pelusios castaneus TaxID=367368 RepID=A0A8C8VQE2_9SAUR